MCTLCAYIYIYIATQPEDIKNEAEVTINESAASGSSGSLQNFHL